MKSLSDRLVQAYMRGERIPLKGTATLVLRNEETGEVKIIKKSNMVTHAVADVLSKNYCGLANFGAIQPLKSLFSGCLLFQNTITENADNYNPPNDMVNPLIAHASQQPHPPCWAPVPPDLRRRRARLLQVPGSHLRSRHISCTLKTS